MPEIELDSTCFTDRCANIYTNNTIKINLATRKGIEPLYPVRQTGIITTI